MNFQTWIISSARIILLPTVYDLIVEETIRYAKNFKNDYDFWITKEDIKIFIGFLICSGYHTLPSEWDY